MRRFVLLLALLGCGGVRSELARVKQQEIYGSQIRVLNEEVRETATEGMTSSPSSHEGYIFIGWTLYPVSTNLFSSVDSSGRTLERAKFMIYEDVTLTANYLPEHQDTDVDGIPDGYEYYWFGSLSHDAVADTDGDGLTDLVEFAAGTNPLFADSYVLGGVESLGQSAVVDYNPYNLHPYTVRCEPEKKLFATYSAIVEPGTVVKSPVIADNSVLAYWTLDGVRQADEFGRALESVTFTTTGKPHELVAVCETDTTQRSLLQWFGTMEVDEACDTDRDGLTDLVEIEAGTNPLLADTFVAGGVESAGKSAVVDYNPLNLQPYTVRCEPENKLFKTYSGIVGPGTVVASPVIAADSVLAYWTLDGVRQTDAFGRSLSSVTFTTTGHPHELVAVCEADETKRVLLQWFGTTEVDTSQDTDGDGLSDLTEIDMGTNPLFADSYVAGGVSSLGVSVPEWVNLQIYEQVDLFTVGDEAVSFNRAGVSIAPYLSDVDGDGLFDVVLKYGDGQVLVLRNCGSRAYPVFETMGNADLSAFDWGQNDLSKLVGKTFDVPMEEGITACYGLVDDLLVSDTHGRIWYYTLTRANPTQYVLQHRIWGGSYYGFAEGLRIATVDWDDDGDLDCLCGTADGRLFLMRNPDVGHPTGLSMGNGVDNVILVWDPITKNCIRGYRVYRNGTRIDEVSLPLFRDTGLMAGTYTYQVSSVSRFFRAGSSDPIEVESPLSSPTTTRVGNVTFTLSNQDCGADRVVVTLALNNSLNYDVSGKTFTLAYDGAKLRPIELVKSGLTVDVTFTEELMAGHWLVTGTEGIVQPGSGRFLQFVFERELAFDTTDLNLTIDSETLTCSIAGIHGLYGLLGDVNENGILDKNDLQLLARLMNGTESWTARQLSAGDFNGNGRLDEGDYMLARAYFRQAGVL